MKNTVKLFLTGTMFLIALIGFAACKDPGNNDPGGDITWSAAADGTANTADSTKITFTFSAAVSGLAATDITLTDETGSATKGSLTGSGTSWDLGITVATAGTVSVKVTKGGVSATAQNVTVHKASATTENPVIGGTSYINDGRQVVFSASAGDNGTYTLNDHINDDGEYTWKPKMEGAYAWDSIAQTVTLTPEKIADDDGVMTDKADALPLFKGWVEEEIEDEIEGRFAWSGTLLNETRDDAEAAILESHNEENGTAYTSLEDLIDALADIRLDETFASRSYTHTFSSDNVSLILLQALPAPVGTDELAGKTYIGTIFNFMGASDPDPDHTFVFSADGTYIETGSDGAESSTGTYSYNSTTKQVYLKWATKDGTTPEQYYDETPYYPEFNRLPEPAHRTSQTYQHFLVIPYDYDPALKVIDSRDSGNLAPI